MKQNPIKSFVVIGITALLTLTSCNSLFDDAPYNKISEETIWDNSMLLDEYVNGWYRNMSHGYKTLVPTHALLKGISRYYLPWFGDQLSVGNTDWFNAGYGDILKANESSITLWAQNTWMSHYTQIQYINTYFENHGSVADPAQKRRIDGEAHFMRAYYYYMLWRSYGGVFIIDHTFDPLKKAETFPRASYDEMVEFIVGEAKKAADLLPVEHDNANLGRATRGAALMLIAKTYLWASSTTFQKKDKAYLGFTEDKSAVMLAEAKKAYEVLFELEAYDLIPISATTQDGIKDEYRKIFLTKNSVESIFEVQHSDDGDYANKFGHKLDRDAASPFFTGTTAAYTPTHNHVLEYGMREGKEYDAANPYENRDPRLALYILYNGQPAGPQNTPIYTAADGTTNDALNRDLTSTRTGYYMKKLLCQTANPNPNSTSNAQHYKPYIRYTEIFLGYAEAANEAWGPKNGGSNGFSAYDVIKAIRQRAGICVGSTDQYLEECAQNKDKMRELIRNERRLELCFEGHRFWDLRRWKANLTESAKGMSINGTAYTPIDVEVRSYQDYMNYGPIPYGEVIKYSNLLQNDGWK